MSQVNNTVQVYPSTSANVEMSFCFLDLPAELRNYVYNYATGSLTATVKLSHHPNHNNTTPAQGISASTRVCKKLREEFLPLYMSAVKTDIDHCDLETFVSTFASTPVSGVFTSSPLDIWV